MSKSQIYQFMSQFFMLSYYIFYFLLEPSIFMNKISPALWKKQTSPSHPSESVETQIPMRITEFSSVEIASGLQKHKLQTTPEKENKQCRICFQTEIQSSQPLAKLCKCTGSVQYVHQTCFSEWIKVSSNQKSNQQIKKMTQEGIQCEICKTKMDIKILYEKSCTDWSDFKQKIKLNRCEFITLCLILIGAVFLLIFISCMVPDRVLEINLNPDQSNQSQKKRKTESEWSKIVVLISFGILAIVFSLSFYFLISQFGLNYRMKFAFKGNRANTKKGIMEDK